MRPASTSARTDYSNGQECAERRPRLAASHDFNGSFDANYAGSRHHLPGRDSPFPMDAACVPAVIFWPHRKPFHPTQQYPPPPAFTATGAFQGHCCRSARSAPAFLLDTGTAFTASITSVRPGLDAAATPAGLSRAPPSSATNPDRHRYVAACSPDQRHRSVRSRADMAATTTGQIELPELAINRLQFGIVARNEDGCKRTDIWPAETARQHN